MYHTTIAGVTLMARYGISCCHKNIHQKKYNLLQLFNNIYTIPTYIKAEYRTIGQTSSNRHACGMHCAKHYT